jgi:hypothetical protein
MTTDRVKKRWQAKPFKPFQIHVADGDVLNVTHPELMWIHPGGRTLFVATGPKDEDRVAIVDLLLVTKLISATNGNGNGTRKPRK